MKKTLLVLQGQFNNETLRCARTFKKLDLDILLIVWQNNESDLFKDEFIIEKIKIQDYFPIGKKTCISVKHLQMESFVFCEYESLVKMVRDCQRFP